jgi:hypothetical protein
MRVLVGWLVGFCFFKAAQKGIGEIFRKGKEQQRDSRGTSDLEGMLK